MIKVISSWRDVGDAYNALAYANMPLHRTFTKNWDLHHIYNILKTKKREITILDFGCKESTVLSLSYKMGFRNIYGVDLYTLDSYYNIKSYFHDWYLWIGRKIKYGDTPYYLIKGDGLHTSLSDESFDVITSVSVLEHNVDLNMFFKEMSRLLKQNGILYISVDFSYKKIITKKNDWNIFSKQEIDDLLTLAKKHNFKLVQQDEIPNHQESIVFYNGFFFTFLSISFIKEIID